MIRDRQLQLPSLEDPPKARRPKGNGTISYLRALRPFMKSMAPGPEGWLVTVADGDVAFVVSGKIPFTATKRAYEACVEAGLL